MLIIVGAVIVGAIYGAVQAEFSWAEAFIYILIGLGTLLAPFLPFGSASLMMILYALTALSGVVLLFRLGIANAPAGR